MNIPRSITLLLLVLLSMAHGKRGGASRSRGRSSSRSRTKFVKRIAKTGSIQHTSLFRSTVLGATAGYVTFQAGRSIINHPSQGFTFDNRVYFWDSAYYTASDELPTQCVNKIDPLDPQLGKVYFSDESRPTEIVYGCPEGEVCCGYECCRNTTFFTSLFSLLIMILVFAVLGIFCIEAFRWGLQCMYSCRTSKQREFEPLTI